MNLNKKTTTAGETVSISYGHGEADFSDLVHVVRCKDCKYYSTKKSFNTDDFECHECLVLNKYMRHYDFCSYGERKEE